MLAKTSLSAAVVAAGAFSVYFVAREQADIVSTAVVAATFSISAIISPVFSHMAGKAKRLALCGFALVAAGFTLVDSYGLATAWQAKEAAGPQNAYELAMADYADQIAPDVETIADANEKLMALAVPASTDTYGSRTAEVRKSNEASSALLNTIKAEAEKRIAAIAKPAKPVQSADFLTVFWFALAFQGLLAIGFASIAAYERQNVPEATNAPEAVETAPQVRSAPIYDTKVIRLMDRIGKQVAAG